MHEYCHRCGGDLTGDTQFCPHCGAPQLTLALEQQSAETGGERSEGSAADADGAATGTAPPPRALDTVDWRVVIHYAAIVAVVGAVLSLAAERADVLKPVSWLWMLSAAMVTVGLYQKRLPGARVDAGTGARIGVVVGLCLAVGVGIAMAGMGIAQRYLLHGMSGFDGTMAAATAQVLTQMQQQSATQHTPLPPELTGLVQSPEFRAAAMLAGYAMLAAVLMVISAVGGAFSGLLRTRKS